MRAPRGQRFISLLLFVAALAVGSAPVHAQDTSGGIAGRILAEDGAPIADASVQVSGRTIVDRTAVTGPSGAYRLSNLPPGTYELEVRRLGHRTVRIEGIVVRLGQITFPAGGAIALPEAGVELTPLVVEAEREGIDVSTAAVETTLRPEGYLGVPTTRDYRDLALLTPQASASGRGDPVNISGATGLENQTFVDGFNTTNAFLGSAGTKLPYNFVTEFQVKSNGYEAEYGGASGGIFNAITRSGGDSWKFEGFGYFNSAGLTADSRLGLAEFVSEGADQYDVGVAVGGPLVADRLWFFGAYDPTFSRDRIEIPGHGFFDDRLTEHLFAIKFDSRLDRSTDATLAFFGDPARHDRVGGGPFSDQARLVNDPEVYLNRVERGGVNLTGQVTHRAGDRLTIDFQAGHQWLSEFDGPRPGDDAERYDCLSPVMPCGPEIPAGSIGGGFGEAFGYEGRRLSLRASAALTLDDHDLKLGVGYETAALLPYTGYNSGLGVILDFGPGSEPFRWLVIAQERNADLRARAPTVYLQDSWQVSDQFRLNAGLRWDAEYLVDSEGSVAQSFTDEWQPRLGFVFTPGAPGVQKITGSAGRFYHRMPLRTMTGNYADLGTSVNSIEFFDGDPLNGGQPIDGTYFAFCCTIQPERDLKGTHFDELTLGYERRVGDDVLLGVRGIHRTLREVVNVGAATDGSQFPGNPGRDELSNLDSPERTYWALELTADYAADNRFHASASYVLSRSYGNFPGIYQSDGGYFFPNENGIFISEFSMEDNEGFLPNDRRHRLKLWGSYRFDFGLTAGTFFTAQSGTPISRYQFALGTGAKFLTPRGSEGRYPALWDWSVRLQYPFGSSGTSGPGANLVLDLMHIGNPQRVVRQVETEGFGDLSQPEPDLVTGNYGIPIEFQPPFSVRLGLEVRY